MENEAAFLRFLRNVAVHKNGWSSIEEYIRVMGKSGEPLQRMGLIKKIKKVLKMCGGEESSAGVDFLIGKVICDVEKVFLKFAGEVTAETVFLGCGSREGLHLIINEDLEGYEVEKFEWIHEQWQRQLEEMSEPMRNALGWKMVQEGGVSKVVSMLTNREYSLTDTEHGLCKLWILARLVHSSRNVAELNDMQNRWCFPVPPGDRPWLQDCLKILEKVLQAYQKTKDAMLRVVHWTRDFILYKPATSGRPNVGHLCVCVCVCDWGEGYER